MRASYAMSHSKVQIYSPPHYSFIHSSPMRAFELVKLLVEQKKAQEGLSVLQIATQMHRASFQGTLHKFLSGLVDSPTHSTAERIARYFGLPLEAMYDDKVATRIAVVRGLIHREKRDALPMVANEPAPVTRIGQKHEVGLNPTLIARIGQLPPKQLRALESMVSTFLDAVAPEAAPSKALETR